MSITPNRTTTIPIITCGGTFITPGAGYHNRHRIGVGNVVSPPMRSGSSIPPHNARQQRVGGIIINDVANNRISNTVVTHYVRQST